MSIHHLILIVVVFGAIMLPFLPTIAEWLRPTDVTPLPMQRNELNSLTFFADNFRTRIKNLYDIHLQKSNPSDTEYHILSHAELSVIDRKINSQTIYETEAYQALERSNHIVIFTLDTQLRANTRVHADVYTQHNLTIGTGTQLRACLAEGNIVLESNVIVHRWIHGVQIQVNSGVSIEGRITATEKITFSAPATFIRAGAPNLYFGSPAHAVAPAQLPPINMSRQVMRGNTLLDAHHATSCDYVIYGHCQVTTGISLIGGLKSHGNLHINANCCIAGSLVTKQNIVIDANCAILGPLISSKEIYIGPNCRIGRPDAPTTLVCQQLTIASGCIVHGVITAYEITRVVT